jgi:hypothetical protein
MLSPFRAGGSLFHTAAGVAYADLIIDSHRETWAIRSRQFRNWLRKRYFDETGDALSSATLTAALDLLEAKAVRRSRSICALRSMMARSIWTWRIRLGNASKLMIKAGG